MSAAKTKDAGKENKGKEAGKEQKGQPKEQRAPKEARQPAPREGRKAEAEAKEAAKEAAPREKRPERPAPVPRLQVHYRDTVVKQMMAQFGYKTTMEVPRIQKIVLNMGVGEAVADKKIMDNAVSDMTKIAGQKPLVTNARKAIANYKIRQGYPIGCKVTLRGARMYEFLDRLVNIAMPRIRDFRGISGRSFDGRGNYNMGVKEQIIFPEIEYDKIDAVRGMNITIATTAKNDNEAKALLAGFRFPFRN
jgi:large subunit ribosomal protein L5